ARFSSSFFSFSLFFSASCVKSQRSECGVENQLVRVQLCGSAWKPAKPAVTPLHLYLQKPQDVDIFPPGSSLNLHPPPFHHLFLRGGCHLYSQTLIRTSESDGFRDSSAPSSGVSSQLGLPRKPLPSLRAFDEWAGLKSIEPITAHRFSLYTNQGNRVLVASLANPVHT
ncbi:unnamed protein product, partial [Pleuronectes platessa]